MMIPSAAVIAEKGGKGKPNDTSGTTPTGDTSGTTPTGDTSGELDLPHSDEYLCLNFGLNCQNLSGARDAGWSLTDYYAYCLSWDLDPSNGECYDPMGVY